MNDKLNRLIEKLQERENREKIKKEQKIKKERKKELEKIKNKKRKEKLKKIKKEEIQKEKEQKKINKEKREMYLIVLTSQKRRIETISIKYKYSDAITKYNEILKENKNVVFPVRFILNNRITRKMMEADYELLLIRKTHEDEDKSTELRNEFGKFVEAEIVDSDKLKILNKDKYYKEETFWVFGYNPKTERKNFNFIYEKFFLSQKGENGYFKRILVFLNKIIIQYDNDIELVLCKNKEDAIRFYNVLSEMTSKDKIKNVFFNGLVAFQNRKYIIELIMKKTGWNKVKINRSCTQT